MSEWKSASWKQEEDHSAEATAVLEEVNATTVPVLLLSSTDGLDALLGRILSIEKKARFGGDTLSTQRCAVEVVKILRTLQKRDAMMEQIDSLMKKRGQMKQVQSAMIHEAAEALKAGEGDDTSPRLSRSERMSLLQQLKHQSEGKIHVELEHARFTMQLATMMTERQPNETSEDVESNKRQASDLLHAVQVETITNMPRLEKVENVLRQLELSLDLMDPTRTQQLSRKMNPRALGKADTAEPKVRYFKLMSQHYERQKEYLVMARCWHEIYLTIPSPDELPPIGAKPSSAPAADAADPDDADAAVVPFGGTKKYDALSNAVVLALLSGYRTAKEIDDAAECTAFSKQSLQTDRSAWLVDLAANRDVANNLPTIHKIVKAFNDVALLRTTLADAVEGLASTHPMTAAFPDRLEALRERLSEHDVMVASKYYTRIRLSRLAELVQLSVESVEMFLMKLVQSKSLYGKIDRIDGVVVFTPKANPIDQVRSWNERVNKMATLIDRTVQLIAKERMLIAVGGSAGASAAAA